MPLQFPTSFDSRFSRLRIIHNHTNQAFDGASEDPEGAEEAQWGQKAASKLSLHIFTFFVLRDGYSANDSDLLSIRYETFLVSCSTPLNSVLINCTTVFRKS